MDLQLFAEDETAEPEKPVSSDIVTLSPQQQEAMNKIIEDRLETMLDSERNAQRLKDMETQRKALQAEKQTPLLSSLIFSNQTSNKFPNHLKRCLQS